MTLSEKRLVRIFLEAMVCNVGTRYAPDDEVAVRMDKEEIEIFNKLANIVGCKPIV